MYQSKLFDRKVVGITKSREGSHVGLVVHEGEILTPTKDHDWLYHLSYKWFEEEFQDDENSENEDKRAILAHAASMQSIIMLHDIIGYFLKDIVYAISEVQVMPVRGQRSVLVFDSNNKLEVSSLEHFILVIALKNNSGTFVLDLCGAQYGFYQPISRFDEYKARGRAVGPPALFNGPGSIRYRTEHIKDEKTRRGALTRLNLEVSQKLFVGAVNWEHEYGTPIAKMLQASPTMFENRKEGLLHYVAYEVQECLDKMTGAKDPFRYMGIGAPGPT
ncbi:uncharacterized protein RSE6_14442 [Rhynchosporium secalis]|uniref:Uncharacterized protein n=1 Tax=Rhynchosporium secalis TaxID=38038 RepID=A0A1E1MVA9_RHYSE|nr:uncharacterized protein RSE6_14442 [Rhynchosporium secalis]